LRGSSRGEKWDQHGTCTLAVIRDEVRIFTGTHSAAVDHLLESALARPINKFAHGETDLAVLAG
jgi:hypothetical protein